MRQLSPRCLYETWKKSGGRLLCLDIGREWTGVAISETSPKHGNTIIRPLFDKQVENASLHRKSPGLVAKKLRKMIPRLNVTAIVAGCPLDRFGRGPTDEARENIYPFFTYLDHSLDIPYTLIDERYTTRAVEFLADEEALKIGDTTVKRIKDGLAAVLIGEEFMDANNTPSSPFKHQKKPTDLHIFLRSIPNKWKMSEDELCSNPNKWKMSKDEICHRIILNGQIDLERLEASGMILKEKVPIEDEKETKKEKKKKKEKEENEENKPKHRFDYYTPKEEA